MNKFDLYLIPLILFLLTTLYFYIIGAKTPLEYSFIIFGTQLIIIYILITIGEGFTHKKSNKIIWLILFIIFIIYNIIFFHYEGIEKLDNISENLRNVNIDLHEERASIFFNNINFNFRNSEFFAPENKYQCINNSDCILSYTTNERFNICISKEYFETVKENNYKKVTNSELSCICKNNVCIRNDFRNKNLSIT